MSERGLPFHSCVAGKLACQGCSCTPGLPARYGYASWQFRFLLDEAAILGESDIAIEPVVSGIIRWTWDTESLPKAVAHLFDAKVGAGFLLGTGMRLREERPEAEYLLDCLIRHLMNHPATSDTDR